MKNRDELTKRFSGQLASDLVNGNKATSNRMTLLILAMLAFIGEEAVQVIFRNNFGVRGLSILRIILCFLMFELIAVLFFIGAENISPSMQIIGNKSSFIWAGFFYILLGSFVLIKGILEIIKARRSKKPYNFAGESSLLKFLTKDGWTETRIQNVAEPFLMLALGIGIGFINILWGIPIVYCALSVWGCKIIDTIFIDSNTDQKEYHNHHQGRNFFDAQ